MAPLPMKTIEHFTHPSHQLFEINSDSEYLCDGCKTLGIGTRFRCHSCDFNLHEYCGTCPMTLSSFMHPEHQLNLVVRKPPAERNNQRVCDVCREHVEGLFYRCELCDFDVHPLCTQLPQQVQHSLRPAHPLTLQSLSSGRCLVCKNDCTSWRYRCGICCVDIHLECLFAHSTESSSMPGSVVQQPNATPAALPPGFSADPYKVPPCGIAYNYSDYDVPSGSSPRNEYHYQHPNDNQQAETRGRSRKKIYKVVGMVALRVVSVVVNTVLS